MSRSNKYRRATTPLIVSSDSSSDNVDMFWAHLQKIFSEIPNFILWNALYHEKKAQVQEMEIISKKNIEKVLKMGNDGKAALRTAISKLYAKHICLETNRLHQLRAKPLLDNDYVMMYDATIQSLRAKFIFYNDSDIDDEFIDEYMHDYCTNCYSKAQIDYLRTSLDAADAEIEAYNRICDEHESVIRSLKVVYQEIEDLYCSTRANTISLSHVKEKLAANEKSLEYLVQSKSGDQQLMSQNSSVASCLNSSSAMNRSVMLGSRSDLIADSAAPALMPQWSTELKLFLDVPMRKLKEQLHLDT